MSSGAPTDALRPGWRRTGWPAASTAVPRSEPQERPLLVIQGREDKIVPPAMNEAFAAKFPRVYLWLVPGGHTTERIRPWIIAGAMQWLAQRAAPPKKPAEEEEAQPLP